MESRQEGHRAVLNPGGELEMEMYGYKTHHVRLGACILGCVLSCGLLLLVFYWKPEWSVWTNCVPCSLEEADVVLLRTLDDFKQYTRKRVRWVHLASETSCKSRDADNRIIADEDSIVNKVISKPELKVRYIQVRKIKYAWVRATKTFQKVGELEDILTSADIHLKYGSGLTAEEQVVRRLICGPNTIEIEMTPLWKLFMKEVLNIFYLHQFFTLGLWLSEGYIEFASVILFISFVSIGLTLYELRKQSTRLHNLVEAHNKVCVTVCRKNGGESIPVTKTQLPLEDSGLPWKVPSGEDHKRHVLFCGTEVIQTKPAGQGPVKAVVLRTGFNTAKGDLVRSILYPRPLNFKLHRDTIRVFIFISGLGVVGTIYTVVNAATAGAAIHRIIIDAILILTGAFSPAIPAALAAGTITAQRRLKQHGIFCISPQRINISGQVNLICFDKTGTLTEDGMDLWGIVATKRDCFQMVQKFPLSNALPWGPLLGAMASCHSLIILDGEIQGDPLDLKMFEATGWEIVDSNSAPEGEGISTSNMRVRPGTAAAGTVAVQGIVVLHQYPFSSKLQRMSVITQVIGGSYLEVYMKGAPEMVASFCKKETVPTSFAAELELYTLQGFRVIGLAHKVLLAQEVAALTREDSESDLEFIGFLILENRLKSETKPVLQELSAAQIRTVMVTGDNLQTAVTVAKSSAMISDSSRIILVEAYGPDGATPASITFKELEENKPNGHRGLNGYGIKEIDIDIEEGVYTSEEWNSYHFAVSGKSYQNILHHFYSLLQKLLLNGTVFARMTPSQKSSLIEEFQKMGYVVAMCGDGANDCGALKMAHAGISLSEQEASVASPFTSKMDNIQCVVQLLKEGRAALVTSFSLFRYMVLYGLITYTTVLILYWQRNFFGNYQFLIQDLVITLPSFLTMSLNAPATKLAKYRPPGHLCSPPILFSVVFNMGFSLAMMIYGLFMVQQQAWYSVIDFDSACSGGAGNLHSMNVSLVKNVTSNDTAHDMIKDHRSFENTTLWLLCTGNLVIIAFVFSKGRPFRKPVYRNYPFLLFLMVHAALCVFFIFVDSQGVYIVMELVCTPILWRVHIILILIVAFAVLFIVEEVIIGNRDLWVRVKTHLKLQPLSRYKALRQILELEPDWPPVNKTLYPSSLSLQIEDSGFYCNPAVVNADHFLRREGEGKEPSGQCANGHVH
ncbi:probable cation-transporting ATPase 13A4 isoform X2 [Pleurodeles waltl]|uniref:probable cation-transporting ATPase 13A4 isoform X2 n=1 Tax=Pleurodeles waltl TaxID=8319 RepID=UPI003709761D